MIVETLEQTPRDATHWSTSLAAARGCAINGVRIWRAFGLKPHLVDSFKLSPDPSSSTRSAMCGHSTRRTRRWCCAWMRNPRSSAGPHRPDAAAHTRHPQRRTHDYKRNGTQAQRSRVLPGKHSDHSTHRRGVPPLLNLIATRGGVTCTFVTTTPPQDPRSALAAAPSRFTLTSHTYELAQPGRALVRRAHQPLAPPRPTSTGLVASIRTWTRCGTTPKPFVGTRPPTTS